MSSERTPLLRDGAASDTWSVGNDAGWDHHHQFCHLVGLRPRNLPPDQHFKPNEESLYSRATHQKWSQNIMYQFTAAFTNTLILSQVVLGATLTGLGASKSSPILVTIFGALNTVIAGVIAFLKSRGQPMRARMFRDDLERVVDEIENSAVMWLGISKGAHGYDAIDIDDQVTVRGEVARLTRLYDKAVKTNTLNDPDMYSTGQPGDLHSAALRDRTGQPAPAPPPPAAQAPAADPIPPPPVPGPATTAEDPDASPATKAPEPPKPEPPADAKPATSADPPPPGTQPDTKTAPPETAGQTANAGSAPAGASASMPAPVPAPIVTTTAASAPPPNADPDESPATVAHPQKHSEDTSTDDKK